MNYSKIYDALMATRANREKIVGVYYERHHIVPRCLGGKDRRDNLVYLTPREHYIAHLLLFKKSVNKNESIRMAYALNAMKRNQVSQRNLTTTQYDNIRTIYGKSRSENMLGSANHFFGKTHSEESRLLISKSNRRSYEEKFGDEADLIKNKIRNTLMGRTPWNKNKKVQYSDQGIYNIKQGHQKLRGEYLITHPDGTQEKINNLTLFCNEAKAKGIHLTKSGFKNLLNNKNRITNTYKGYSIIRVTLGSDQPSI